VRSVVLVLAALTMLAAACGDGDGDDSAEPPGSTAPPSVTDGSGGPGGSTTTAAPTPSTGPSAVPSTTEASTTTGPAAAGAACLASQLLAVPAVAGSGPWADIDVGKCRDGYAHAWTVPQASNLESEQWFFVEDGGAWAVLTSGTGVECADTAGFAELEEACAALGMSPPPPGVGRADIGGWAEGSGCTPGSGGLHDGRWYGLIVEADETAIGFDLACWFTAYAEQAAATEDGEVTNDYWIINDNSLVRDVTLAAGAEVLLVDLAADDGLAEPIDVTEWLAGGGPEASVFDYWIVIRDGAVVRITEAYRP
jgi:hypothetical protein